MAALVMLLLMAAAVGASTTADRVVEQNEHRLLLDRAGEVRSLLESIGSTYEAQMASVAAIAQVTDGNAEQFRTAVEGVSPGAGTSTEGGWALLRRTADGWVTASVVGAPTDASGLPAEWTPGLDQAATGHFTALGFLGEGLGRRFALATGRPGLGGDLVTYNEVPLLGAAASAADGENPLTGIAVEVFIGTKPDADQVLLSFGDPDETNEVRQVVDISGVSVLLEVSPTSPLGGGLARDLPKLLLGGGLVLALAIAAVVEMSQRRRDDAMDVVRGLERQNRLLDRALEEQRAAEEARAALEIELRQAQRLEAVGHLAGGVAHDFNNVLAAILSYADLASDAIREPGPLADLESIQAAARRGAGLTRQLLQFSRREVGEASIIDLNERITDVASMLSRTLGEDISLRTRLSPTPATVLADPVELDQIILNLVVNARDALQPGGHIEVATQHIELDRDDVLNLPSLHPGIYVRLTVTDDGSGMSADILEHAFEPFFTTKGRGQGTGLGLSTVYGIVQRQGGHVVATSDPGRWTEIEVLLPAAAAMTADPVEPPAPVASAHVGSGAGRTVLLVEDEAPLRRAIRRMLESGGYVVLEAEDGATALERLDEPVDLLLTDIVMPGGLTGVDVADSFRARMPRLPVVFMTGYSDTILDPARLEATTPTVLLPKPFTEVQLLEVVGSAMGVMTA
jgi:signal transduction histidine kinase/CheY-like chemotaxis protein